MYGYFLLIYYILIHVSHIFEQNINGLLCRLKLIINLIDIICHASIPTCKYFIFTF